MEREAYQQQSDDPFDKHIGFAMTRMNDTNAVTKMVRITWQAVSRNDGSCHVRLKMMTDWMSFTRRFISLREDV